MNQNNESVEKGKEPKLYHHLQSWRIENLQSSEPMYQYGDMGRNAPRRYPPHNFYEGTVQHDGKDAIFFLQKHIPDDKTFAELGIVITESALGNINYTMSQDSDLMGNERFDRYQEASALFDKHNLPKDLWNKREIATAHTLYEKFAIDADIIVPGYVTGVSVDPYGEFVSEIDIVPTEDRPKLEALLKKRDLNGLVTFW